MQLLQAIGAMDEQQVLSPLGYHLAKMPVPPKVGKMLLWAVMLRCVEPIATIAAARARGFHVTE